MRHALLLVLAPLAAGCAESCPLPSAALNASLWHVSNHIVEWSDGPIDPAYPGESSPMNGSHDVIIAWASNADTSVVTLTIDGQAATGEGTWNSQECGNFTISTVADYFGDDGTKHAFAMFGRMQTWSGHLEGVWEVSEVWTLPDGQTQGDGDMVVQVIGTL